MDHSGLRRWLAKSHLLTSRALLTWICILLYWQGVVSQRLPGDKDITVTHNIGTDAVLTCTVSNLGARKIIWSKLSDPYPISVGNSRFNPSRKYQVKVNGSSTALTIKNVRLEDAGEYQCRVSGQIYMSESVTLNIQSAAGDTYLLPSKTEVSAAVGETALLTCLVENIKKSLVLWKNAQYGVLSLRKKILSGDSRMSIKHDKREEWNLQIKNLQPSDFGLYTCVVNSQPVLTRTVYLNNSASTTHSPLLIQDTSFKKRWDVASGETVRLVCNFKANPPAMVTWYRKKKEEGGKTIKEKLGEGNFYTLMSVSPAQSGQYVCEGDNGIPPVARHTISLEVPAPPTAAPVLEKTTFLATSPIAPVLYQQQQRLGIAIGSDARLKCTAIGHPRPTLFWKRHGERIDINNPRKYQATEENFRGDTLHSTLLVRTLGSRDYGEYVCWGHNTLGLNSIAFEIYRT